MRISNAERAVVDLRKLLDYCLSPTHDEGKHKARVFAAVGIAASDARDFCDMLLEAVKMRDAELGRRDGYGQRYVVDFAIEWRGQRSRIRSGWIVEHGSDTPRLTTCYPL